MTIVARGYSPDVVSTLDKNHRLGNLFIFPLKIEGTDEVFDLFKNHDHIYNLENIQNLRSVTASEFDYKFEIDLDQKRSLITGFDAQKRKVHVCLPLRWAPVLGIIKDRVDLGLKLCREVSSSGHASNISNQKFYSRKSLNASKQVSISLQKSLENLSCIVLQEKT